MKTILCAIFLTTFVSSSWCNVPRNTTLVAHARGGSSETISDMNLISVAMGQYLSEYGMPLNAAGVNWLLVLTGDNPKKLSFLSRAKLNPMVRGELLCDQWGHSYRFFSGVGGDSVFIQSAGVNGEFDYTMQSDDVFHEITWIQSSN